MFFFRSRPELGQPGLFPRISAEAEDGEILEAFLGQFYTERIPPRMVLLSHPIENGLLLAEALGTVAGRRVVVAVPRRGEKRELVGHAAQNAREALGRKLAESVSQARLLAGLAEAFGLDQPPRRIEVYDNSHIQGAHAVGAMIVAGPDGFEKSQYRKFNIKGAELTPGDDFGMMTEMLTRRFQRLVKADPDRETAAWPDLVLIDGGAGQAAAAAAVLAELGIEDIALSASPRGSTATPARRSSTPPATAPSRCRSAAPASISSSACATRPTDSPLAPTGRNAPRRSAPRRSTRFPASAGAQAGTAGPFRLGQGG